MHVTIYSTPTCHFCHMAKDFFAANNVPFTDINVAEDTVKRAEMVDMSGQMGVPVILIKDEKGQEEIIVGFNQKLLSEKLGIKETPDIAD